eukprot:Skav224394  [mRNA]  locus=scaffold2452:95275:100135:- [translate_table: standard]
MANNQDTRAESAELKKLNEEFEEILKRCENQPKEDTDRGERSYPDWYRPPDQPGGIPSWLSQESALAPAQQPDHLARVVASYPWPSSGGFNWQVCLPTSGK